ncbi:MAG: 2-C-methyl-D-erythritol 2,4-cyclodiphosphate synthase [Bacillota bacterium]
MMRIGQSRDIHRLEKGKTLILGGIDIPSNVSAVGHSDADVLLHAISEALLGALALGDLGTHFPDTDETYKDMDSKVLLSRVVDMIKDQGYELVNLDATVHLETPKLASYIMPMKETIASLLRSPLDVISLKATTGEGVGPVGRKEAIEAECVVLVKKRIHIQPL